MELWQSLDHPYASPGAATPWRAIAAGRECPGCRALAYADDRYCACCGTRLGEICIACGSAVRHPVANYCSQCGVPIETRPPI